MFIYLLNGMFTPQTHALFKYYSLKKKIEWIIHSIYGMKKFHSLRSEFHSILTPCSNGVKIYYSTSGISSGSLDIYSKRSDHWHHHYTLYREWRQWQIEWNFTLFCFIESKHHAQSHKNWTRMINMTCTV